MIRPTYSPKQLQNKWIACSVLLDPPSLAAVLYARGEYEGMPVLYNSREEAEEDSFFDESYDEVIPASEYFQRVNAEAK